MTCNDANPGCEFVNDIWCHLLVVLWQRMIGMCQAGCIVASFIEASHRIHPKRAAIMVALVQERFVKNADAQSS